MFQGGQRQIWLVIVLAMAFFNAPAVMSADYLKIAGIRGEATANGHAGEIDVLGWDWGVQSQTTSSSGGGTYRAGISDITFTKNADSVSALLRQFSAQGKRYPEITFATVDAGGKSTVIRLKNAIITSVRSVGGGKENVVFKFEKIEVQPKSLK